MTLAPSNATIQREVVTEYLITLRCSVGLVIWYPSQRDYLSKGSLPADTDIRVSHCQWQWRIIEQTTMIQ